MLINIILLTLFGSILSLLGGVFLLLKKKWHHDFSLKMTSISAGVLLGTSFLDLFPEAAKHMKNGEGNIFIPALAGIILFFLLERTLLWFHHHHEAEHFKPSVWMVTLGDGVHNFIDGVAIAASYLVNPALGMTTAIAVAAHEIPQEIADFSILLARGLRKDKALLFNLASAFASIAGAITVYFFASYVNEYLAVIIAFSGGMFAYIALSDLIPELHHEHSLENSVYHALLFLGGILVVFLFKMFIVESA